MDISDTGEDPDDGPAGDSRQALARLREQRAWWTMTLGLHFLLWMFAVWPVLERAGSHDIVTPALVLTGVVVYPLSWLLWARTHPDPSPPGHSPQRVRTLVDVASLVFAFVAGLIALAWLSN